jgi:hypothetical protein
MREQCHGAAGTATRLAGKSAEHLDQFAPCCTVEGVSEGAAADADAALRELALRFVADESDDELLEHLRRRHSPVLGETAERIMVAVTAAPGTGALLRRAARIALRVMPESRLRRSAPCPRQLGACLTGYVVVRC